MEALTRLAHHDAGDLIKSAAAGDESAFRRIIATHHDDMRRVCQAISGDRTIAEEATQAAWVIAWKKLDRVNGPDHLRPWLVAVAVNEAKKLMSKRKRRAEVEVATDSITQAVAGDPGGSLDLVDLWAALRRMDPDDRSLLAMRYGMGFNSNELAVATGKSPAAIRQRLKRLVDRLREDLGHE